MSPSFNTQSNGAHLHTRAAPFLWSMTLLPLFFAWLIQTAFLYLPVIRSTLLCATISAHLLMETLHHAAVQWPAYLSVPHSSQPQSQAVSPSKARPRSYLYLYPQHFIQGLAHWRGSMSVYWTKLNHKHNAMEFFILSAKKEKIRIRKGFTEEVTLEMDPEKREG